MNVPDPLPVVDGLLAATAKVTGVTVATRNSDEFARTGVSLVGPFSAAGEKEHRPARPAHFRAHAGLGDAKTNG